MTGTPGAARSGIVIHRPERNQPKHTLLPTTSPEVASPTTPQRADLLHALRTGAAGGAVLGPTVADRLGRFFSGTATGAAARPSPS